MSGAWDAALRPYAYVPEAAPLGARGCTSSICIQVRLAEHKPAWDDALRTVVDVAFEP